MAQYTTSFQHDPLAELVDLRTAAHVLGGVSVQTIYRLIADGQLDLVKIRHRSFVTGSSVEELATRGSSRGNRR